MVDVLVPQAGYESGKLQSEAIQSDSARGLHYPLCKQHFSSSAAYASERCAI